MRVRGRLAVAVGVATATVAAVTPSTASTGTAVRSVTARVVAGHVHVAGRAVFVDRPVTVRRDPAGDAVVPGIGADLRRATIARPGGGSTLRFTLSVADLPTVGAAPEAMSYAWPMEVARGGSVHSYTLVAVRSLTAKPGADRSYVAVMQCDPPPASSCTPKSTVAGAVGAKVVWNVPERAIGAAPGAWIRNAAMPIQSSLGADGRFVAEQKPLDAVAGSFGYRVGPWVSAGVVPAGTRPGAAKPSAAASLRRSGQFSASLPTPREAGRYVAVVQACAGTGSCATRASAPFTVGRQRAGSTAGPPLDVVFSVVTKQITCHGQPPPGMTCYYIAGHARSSRYGALSMWRGAFRYANGCTATLGGLTLPDGGVPFGGGGPSCSATQVIHCVFAHGKQSWANASGTFTITVLSSTRERWRGTLSR